MKILKLNEISPLAEKIFPAGALSKDCADPDAIVLRSFNMHDYDIPASVLAVGRAGAGVNNIPVDKCAERGIVVFNTPGANANAVKELVLCALLLSGRKVYDGIRWAQSLSGSDVAKQVESGKKAFVGHEIAGKTLGVIGLGAIGALVANAAIDLHMKVIGYDPFISVDAAWNLNHNVIREDDLNALFKACDFVTLHVPLTDATRGIINKDTIALMPDGAAVINCARGELVDNAAVKAALASGKLSRYVTDFPSAELLGTDNLVTIPHLGASTPEAEDNCAVMVAHQLMDFIDNGNVRNSVNFPACSLPRSGKQRITIIHHNVKNVLRAVTDIISNEGVNIENFVSQSKGDYAYAILDLSEPVSPAVVEKLEKADNVIRLRVL